MRPRDDDDTIPLDLDDEQPLDDYTAEADDYELDAPGPDERDRDLMDGTWEQRHYSGQERQRDWSTVGLAIAILVVLAMVLPGILVLL